MKGKTLLPLALLSLLLPFSAHAQTLVTFDDLSETGTGDWVPTGYQGLTWSNFWCNNAISFTNILASLAYFQGPPYSLLTNGLSGDFFGMISPSNVAYAFGNSAEIDSSGTNFNFLSVYLTGDLNSNLNIEVEGFNGGEEIYDTIVSASATNATLFTFDYFDIDRVYFNAYGGEPAFGSGGNSSFVMDNFTFQFIPEPSSLLLVVLGAIPLCAFLKRKLT